MIAVKNLIVYVYGIIGDRFVIVKNNDYKVKQNNSIEEEKKSSNDFSLHMIDWACKLEIE